MSGGTLAGTGALISSTYTLNGGTINGVLGSGAATAASGTTTVNGTINANLTVSGATVDLTSSDRLGNSSAVAISSGTLGLGVNNDTVASFSITGGTLGGSGTLTAATYSLGGGTVTANLGAGTATASNGTTALDGSLAGNLNVAGGTINIGSSDRLGDTSTVTVSSGTLAVGANTDTVGTLAVNGGTVSGNGTITATAFTAQGGSIETVLAGTGATFSKSGAGSVTLSAANTFDGGSTISGGAVVAANAAALGSGSISMTGDGASLLASENISIANNIVASALIYGGVIISEYVEGSSSNKYIEIYNGTGATISLGDYQLVLYANGAATPSNTSVLGSLGAGSTLAHGEALVLKNSSAALTLPAGVTAYNSTAVNYSGDDALALQFTNGTNIDIFGVIGNDPGTSWTAGSLSTINQTLARDSDVLYGVSTNPAGTGPTAFTTLGTEWTGFPIDTVSNLGSHTMNFLPGSVSIGSETENATVTYSGTVSLDSSAVLTAATGGSTTFSGAISGTNGVTKAGAGTVTLSAANTYSGGTTISAGVLAVGAGSTTGSISGNVVNNATLQFNRSDDLGFSGAISGTGAVTKLGAGTLTLSGAGSYSGATTVSAGTLELADADGAAAGSTASISVASGATLLVSQSGQVSDTASVSLSGGTITRGTGVSETFGALTVSGSSTLDFGSGTEGNLAFGTYTPSSLLTLNSFFGGNVLTFNSDLTGSIAVGTYNSTSYLSGDGLFQVNSISGGFTTAYNGSTFTITAIPEPSTYLAAAGLLSLMLWPSRKRLLKDAKKILGFTPPMRDRLAAKRG
jgi:autotransporter-associated beta strand protein